MSLLKTPSNANNKLSRKDRSARQAPTVYETPISHYVDDKEPLGTPTILDHPDLKTVGLQNLLPRLRERLDDINGPHPPHDLLTGRKIYGGENSQLSHIAHQKIEYLDFFRLSEATGVKYLNPHSTGNVLESLVDVHNLYNQLSDILLPPIEDLERFAVLVRNNLRLINDGWPPINIFEAEGFDKSRLWDYEFTCLDRETPLHVFFNEDGTLILDQISNPGRQIEMPAHGYMMRGIPTHIVYAFLGSAYALNYHKYSAKILETMSDSQRKRARIIQRMARNIGLFRNMTGREYRKLQEAGFAPRTAAAFNKMAGREPLFLLDGDYEVEVAFDPNWKPESELLPGPDGEDTSFEDAQDHPAEEYGISSLEQKRLRKEYQTKKQFFTPKAQLELGSIRRKKSKNQLPNEPESEARQPHALRLLFRGHVGPTPSKSPVKRDVQEDPFASDEEVESPRKKARSANGPIIPSVLARNAAPAATTRSMHVGLAYPQPAAMQEPRHRPTQPAAGPGPRTAANQRRNIQRRQQTAVSPPIDSWSTGSFSFATNDANQRRSAQTQQQAEEEGPPVTSWSPGSAFRRAVNDTLRSRATESTIASRARARAPTTDSQSSLIPRPALPKGKGKDTDAGTGTDKDKRKDTDTDKGKGKGKGKDNSTCQ